MMKRFNYIIKGVKRPDWLIIYLEKIIKEFTLREGKTLLSYVYNTEAMEVKEVAQEQGA